MIALHLLGVVAATSAILLGLWQYDAWQTGRDLAARDLATTRPVSLADALQPDAAFPNDQVGRPVTFGGAWLPESTLLVSDRDLDGRTGFWVVTPVAVCPPGPSGVGCGEAPAILVVRGWSPTRDVPAPPTGRVDVTGWLQPGEGRGLPDPDPADDVLPEMRIASAIQHVEQDLYGGYVIARPGTDAATPGLEPVTPESLPQPGSMTSIRNLLYAVEWWVFGGFALFLWWRWVRDETERAAAADEEAGDEVAEPAEIASSS